MLSTVYIAIIVTADKIIVAVTSIKSCKILSLSITNKLCLKAKTLHNSDTNWTSWIILLVSLVPVPTNAAPCVVATQGCLNDHYF